MIILIIIITVLTIILIILLNKNKHFLIKKIGLISSFISLWLSIILWILNESKYLIQFTFNSQWMVESLHVNWGPINFGVDEISLPFIILTNLLIPICILISWNSINFLVKEFIIAILSIQLLLIIVFTSLNILIFYIAFESILIPMFLIIGVWGSRKEKERAAYYFFFYTLVGSLFMLLGIFILYNLHGSLDYQTLFMKKTPESIQIWVFLGFFLSLAVKIPKIPFHIWLPQAHVEAPVAGSVLLAGVLLKLGGYGFLRFSWTLFPYASQFFLPIIITLSAIGIIYASLTTCRQTDAKKLVAYSSVAHMGLVVIAIFSKTYEGLIASIILMIAHGFVSSGLFIVVTNLYDRFHTRTIKYYKGIVYTMPIFTTAFFLLILGNIAFPIFINFIGEFMSTLSIAQLTWIGIIPPLSGMFLAGVYSLLLFNKISFGQPSHFTLFSRDLTRREFQTPLLLIIFTIILGIKPLLINANFTYPFIQ
uniref:NADH-ubiquinone oxidoreductase chain 4 n=1 Tax=Cassiopea andromeda TaxID=114796 RepID=G9ISC7_CASAN|nr:NADH dehydrogenase subunit 4 [Cassiopea andromeda]